MNPLLTIIPPSPQMATPYGRPRRDFDDPKCKSPRFVKRTAVGLRVTTTKLKPLRITSNRCLPPPAQYYYWRCNSRLPWRTVSNVPTYHTFLLQRSDKGDRAYQRTQGTWLRPHNRKNTQRATQEGYNSSQYSTQ